MPKPNKPKGIITARGYSGVDMRSGTDRRTRHRRKGLEKLKGSHAIGSTKPGAGFYEYNKTSGSKKTLLSGPNKRSGNERRSGKGRRKTD